MTTFSDDTQKSEEPPPRRASYAEAYHPQTFQTVGHRIIDTITSYLERATARSPDLPVYPPVTPDSLLKDWGPLSQAKTGNPDEFVAMMERFLLQCNHLHHPKYMGHQNAVPLPLSVFSDMISSLLNNCAAVFDMGPVETVVEKRLVDWMCEKIGFTVGGGFLTSGGTLGNFTALLAARQVMGMRRGFDVWKDGLEDHCQLAIMTSDQSHYSVRRPMQMMGLGKDSVVIVPTNKYFQVTRETLEQSFAEATAAGKQVIAFAASSCNTGPGTFDDLVMLSEFCKAHDLWLHVDAAHGGPALLSPKYKHLLAGIEHADSVVWDFHKMMMVPGLATAVLFREHKDSYQAMRQDAEYLYAQRPDIEADWYTLCKRTLECTKISMGVKFYSMLRLYGEDFFAQHVTDAFDLAKWFADRTRDDAELELGVEPQSNIVCFRYNPQSREVDDLNVLQSKIRAAVVESGNFYIVQTTLPTGVYLRLSLMNPLTNREDLEQLIVAVKAAGIRLTKPKAMLKPVRSGAKSSEYVPVRRRR